ncbi:MAG TPA: polyprenyl synthetase family protein [Pseudonocardiaceae bacterium]|jgi:heptaprenyl diphosphate synthase|nr:polyprenyl synthetase family protein [Pseudonocardiaceae bacterium]
MPRFELADPGLSLAIKAGLEQVEDVLHSVLHSDVEFVKATALHLVDAGGKRIRPLFTLLAAQFGDGKRQDVITAAAVVELVHIATLYHDDVMDEASMRRGAVSANARWDNTVAILAGDYVFAHASRMVADLGTDAARIIAETFAELVTGQMRETTGPGPGEDPIAHHLSVIEQKTGSLIATAGRYGAMCAGAPAEYVAALRRYGEIIGAAFQISDDIIDIATPSVESGKTPGTDLREGVPTLTTLYALASTEDTPGARRLRSLVSGPLTEDALVDEALELLRCSPALGSARQTLLEYADLARAQLRGLPDCAARDALQAMTDYLIDRTS